MHKIPSMSSKALIRLLEKGGAAIFRKLCTFCTNVNFFIKPDFFLSD